MATRKTGGRVEAAIRERIVRWEYPPNHALGEEGLSREFGVSRSPVREALRVLEAEGFVNHIPNRGFFVRQFKSSEIEELYVVRLALELYSAEFLATHDDTHNDVRALAEPWRGILEGKSTPNAAELAQVDEAFHESLTRLTGNGMLLTQLHSINERLYVFREMDFAIAIETHTMVESCHSHIAVVDAILQGDPVAARETVRANLTMGLGNAETAMGRILLKTFNSAGKS